MTDYRTEAAQQRMQSRSVAESRMYQEGQTNAGGMRRVDDGGNAMYDPAPLSEYPRMLYKQTHHEQIQESADSLGMKDEPYVINRFGPYLCETCIANSLTEAEALAELGWEISPAAAYGAAEGITAAVSAKDERIAELEAMLASQAEAEPQRRGPGRPPKSIES